MPNNKYKFSLLGGALLLLLFNAITGSAIAQFQQSSGSGNLLVMEAENFHNNLSQGGHNWTLFNAGAASGGQAMEATPNSGTNNKDNYVTNSPRLDFDVNFVTTGTHYVWVRGYGPNLGGDSVHVGLDGEGLASSKRIDDFTVQTWDWSNMIQVSGGTLQVATIDVTTTGSHTLNIWMREDGFRADKLLLTTDSGFVPTGTGPAESSQSGGGNNPPTVTNPGDQTNTVGDVVSLQIQANDPDGDTLTYSDSGLPNGLSINSSTGLITGTVTTANTFNPTITVDDGNGGMDSTSFTWTVNTSGGGSSTTYEVENLTIADSDGTTTDQIGSRPEATNGTYFLYNSDAIGEFITFELPISATGSHDIDVQYHLNRFRGTFEVHVADALAGPYTLIGTMNNTISNTSNSFPTLAMTTSFASSGTKYLRFTVTGANPSTGREKIGLDTVVVTGSGGGGNNPPTVTNPGNQTNTVNDSVNLQIQANDPDGDTLTYSASGLPNGLSINSTTGLITGTATTANTFNPTITVDDGNGGMDSTSFTWTVNTSGGGGNRFQQSTDSGNLLVMEAENFHNNVSQGGHNWTLNNFSNASGGQAMKATPDSGTNNKDNYVTNSPRLDFDVEFVTTGTHYVWIRGYGPNLGGDSVHVGLDGEGLASSKRIDDFTTATWDWSNMIQVSGGSLQVATIDVTSLGNHTLNIWMREDGFRADKLLLTTDSTFTPTGTGPAESPQGGSGNITLPFTDNFNDGNANGWVVRDEAGDPSNWTVSNNQYRQLNQVRTGSANLNASYHLGSFSYLDDGFQLQDYQATIDVIPRGDLGDDIGIMFRYQDINNYYRLTFDSRFGFTRLEKRVGGQFSSLASNSIGYIFGQSVEFKITVDGSMILVELDGDPLFIVEDNSITQGTIALYSAANSRFDNVNLQTTSAPRVVLATPTAHSIITGNDITASALVINPPAGASVRFILDGSNTKTDSTSPYSRNFNNVAQGEHTVEAKLLDSGGAEVANDINTVIGTEGDSYLTIGDSLTNGARDNFATDNASADGRNFGFQGYQASLNDSLTSTRGYPHLVVNEGIGGDDSDETLNLRLDSILSRNPDTNQVLMFLGTNDAAGSMPIPSGLGCSGTGCNGTYKGNMQDIIDDINTSGKSTFVAQAPPSFGTTSSSTPFSDPLNTVRNNTIQEYNQVIVDELTNRSVGPNLFECFLSGANRFSLFEDNYHPNGLGYAVISRLWHDILTEATLPTDPCVPPIFILENLKGSTVAPYNKQNLIEVGDEYYVDESFTITSIPGGLNLNNGIWIMTANSDSSNSSNNYLEFDVDRNVTVYVAYDDRATSIPNWLNNNFSLVAGSQINVSQGGGNSLDLYSNSYSAGTITLGGNQATGASGALVNYIVIVVE